uniref:Ubiquitin carboxyl-terminal hydrolase n=1 Tax=Panagrellus redivivus TaxID=6233 RepID=A0A7E4WAJ9_PANRE
MASCSHVTRLNKEWQAIGKSVGRLMKAHRQFRKDGFCTVCNARDRLYFCLFCPKPFCFKHYDYHLSPEDQSSEDALMKEHDKLPFGINIDDTKLFCFKCQTPVISDPFNYLRESMSTLQPSDMYFTDPDTYSESTSMLADIRSRWYGFTGLANAGNHCYANAVLQVMLHSASLIHVFCASSYHKSCDYYKKSEGNKPLCLRCEIRRLFSKYTEGHETSPLNAFRILFLVNKYRKNFSLKAQQDCNEFTMLLFELIRLEDARDRKKFLMSTLISPIDALFTGKTYTHKTCTTCGHRWTTKDAFTTFAVPIRPTIKTAFETAFNDERNHSYCVRCGRDRENLCRRRIHTAPVILSVCLQRFVHGIQRMVKVSDKVDVNEELNVGRFIVPMGDESEDDWDDWDDDSVRPKRRKQVNDENNEVAGVNEGLIDKFQSLLVNENAVPILPEATVTQSSPNRRKRPYPHNPVTIPEATFSTTDCKYVLIGIVYHRGSIDTGHYFTRCANDISEPHHQLIKPATGPPSLQKLWAQYDDLDVNIVKPSEPSPGDAYMAFYVQEPLNSVISVQAYLRNLQPLAILPS